MKKRGVIVAYGRKWKRSNGEKSSFGGIPKIRGRRVGLYVLYKGKRLVYIGKSETSLRRRLNEHVGDTLKHKWDSFSWFITKPKYTADLEALLHKLFFDVTEVTVNRVRASFIEAKRCPEPKKHKRT